jgi:hypothetical protein
MKIPVSQCRAHFSKFSEAVESKNLENMCDSIMDFFQFIGNLGRGKIKCNEYYHRILRAFLLAICQNVRIEEEQLFSEQSDIFAYFGSWKILFDFKAFEGKKSNLESADSKLEKEIGDAFLQMKEKYANGLLADIFCVLVFNTFTRTLFSRSTFKTPFYVQKSDLRDL